MRVGVLASGEGTNLQALLDGVHDPGGAVEIVAVASDRPEAPALARAIAAGVETGVFPRGDFAHRAARDAALLGWFEEREIDLIVLAGYMALLDAAFVARWTGRLVNVHPSLLPAFPGLRAIEQAFAYGVDLYGVTVHLVDEGVDTGPILMQAAVRLPDADGPAEVRDALRPLEHELLCTAVAAFAAGRVGPRKGRPRQWRVTGR